MQYSSFFGSINGDRKYKAGDFASYFASFIGNGVFPNPSDNLKVVANTTANMSVVVKIGKAWINGYYYQNTKDLVLPIVNADGVLKRIDRIVVRWSLLERSIYAVIKTGTLSPTPTAPPIQRDADIYELVLADVSVTNGAVAISKNNIADQRYIKELCGIVAHVVQELDMTEFYNEVSRHMTEQIKLWESQTKGQQEDWENQTQSQQVTWGELTQDQQSQFDALKTSMEAFYSSIQNDISKLQTFDFENILAFDEVEKTSIRMGKNMMQTIRSKITGAKIAERHITNSTVDKKKTYTITTTVYAMDGVNIFKQATWTITRNKDKSITEQVKGFNDYNLTTAYIINSAGGVYYGTGEPASKDALWIKPTDQ